MLRIRDVYPGSRILIFTHPGSRIHEQQQKRGVKKNCCHTFFCSHKFHIIGNYLIFEMLKKKIWANFQIIIELFTQNVVTKLSKKRVWDPGSGKTYSGSRIQGSKKHRIPDPDPQHCLLQFSILLYSSVLSAVLWKLNDISWIRIRPFRSFRI